MVEAVQAMIANTPHWVIWLFAYLMYVGFRATHTQVVHLRKVFIMPIILALMGIETIINAVGITVFAVSIWLFSVAIGAAGGWLMLYKINIDVDKQKQLVRFPGTWLTIILILIIFASKYYFGYELSVDPELAKQTVFEIALLGVGGLCTGLFIGKLANILYRFQVSPHVELEEEKKHKD